MDKAYLEDTVSIAKSYLVHSVIKGDTLGYCLPGEDILRVIVSQIHCSWPTYWDTRSLPVIRFQKVRCLQIGQLLE